MPAPPIYAAGLYYSGTQQTIFDPVDADKVYVGLTDGNARLTRIGKVADGEKKDGKIVPTSSALLSKLLDLTNFPSSELSNTSRGNYIVFSAAQFSESATNSLIWCFIGSSTEDPENLRKHMAHNQDSIMVSPTRGGPGGVRWVRESFCQTFNFDECM